MEPLPTTRQMFTWLCVCPISKTEPQWKNMAYFIGTFFALASTTSTIVFSVVHFWVVISSNVEEALYTVIEILGFGTVTYMMIATLILRREINAIIERLSLIYRQCKGKNN